MNTLQDLAREYSTSVDVLRRVAYERCGVPRETELVYVDLWLYERLAQAANWTDLHFSVMDEENIRRMIEHSLMFKKGVFLEKCAASLAEVIANPIIRREILLPRRGTRYECGVGPKQSDDGVLHEPYGDVLASLPDVIFIDERE